MPSSLSLSSSSCPLSLFTLALTLALLSSPALALDGMCLSAINVPTLSSSATSFNCGNTTSTRDQDMCLLICGFCTTPYFRVGISDDDYSTFCMQQKAGLLSEAPRIATTAIIAVGELQGNFWMDGPGEIEENATVCINYVVANMPRRDMLTLFAQPYLFSDFLFEHIRLALRTWPFSSSLNVPWPIFLDAVVPYGLFDENRDLNFRWRPRFAQLFGSIMTMPNITNTTAAMHVLADMIPLAQPAGTLARLNPDGSSQIVPGAPISWRSEVSPAILSPAQVIEYLGGSCTGTALVLVAACRSIGIPARVAGCSESIARGDDHHWIEGYDSSSPGPFGDNWHTKEGVSYGNTGGPWDSPSGPMNGCLQGVVPDSNMDTIWAASWGAHDNLPTLWANNTFAATWARTGGVNRCGAYCTAWGCGVNQTDHWSQAECGPAA